MNNPSAPETPVSTVPFLMEIDKSARLLENVQFKLLMDQMIEGVQLISNEWKYLYLNKAAISHSHYTLDELIGHTMMEKYPGIESTPLFLVLTACMKEHKPGNIEHEFKYPDGSKGWFELRIQPVPEGLFILSVDISVVKRAQSVIELMNLNLERKVEERTKELERANKELESFSYSISHDLRAPLRAIDGYTRIFMEDHAANADDEGKRLLKVIIDSTARMAHLIDDLLSFSRTGKQEMVKVKLNMNQIAHAITEEQVRLMSAKNARVIIGELPESDGDVRMIRQVFVNLVSNAVKYSSKKKDPVIEIGSLREGEETVYFVKDNGAGFDMRYYEKLFAVFQRLHSSSEFEGTGVGLAIVERIITRHGGRIWAKSELNEGAVFYFTLGNK